jgi:hypothetical protein
MSIDFSCDAVAGPWRLEVCPSLESAAADMRVNYAATTAIAELGVPVEELDI